ncbi:MAG: plasmid encoded RepA protein, partial [Leptolyngbyaceae cyanobacterium RU_5_1]|nr:plasmid encoded RepA protein [Leptolyngbyaceae cyanobacterium RU_5_1]
MTAHPIPVDMNALQHLKNSALALDLYAWLTHEA